jgi:hypothetical protein
LFVFIDESGNFDFSEKGTRHFVMAGVAALAPLDSAAEMQALRYQLLAEGVDASSFHAAEDRQYIRDRVFDASDYQRVVVVFDQALTKKKQGDFHGVIKPELKAMRKPFHIYFQKMVTDMNGQIADYVAWSKYVQLERRELRPWESINASLRPSDFNIFRDGTMLYY